MNTAASRFDVGQIFLLLTVFACYTRDSNVVHLAENFHDLQPSISLKANSMTFETVKSRATSHNADTCNEDMMTRESIVKFFVGNK